ncbi:hypothetical protein EG327_000588 [Venturia inaequalis]|uniref:Uncharacterized protein n=1 Tax=Venturia inaequalis TaxID=5025 RepID=A0A8H3VKW1_VENIN|nr:hypothetical protein EG327_000588 [Venturia inaequalis]
MKRKFAALKSLAAANSRRSKRPKSRRIPEPPISPTRKLPNEIWDHIFAHLMPHEADFLPDIIRDYDLCPTSPIAYNRALRQARTLRLTCKTFAENHVLCSTLFHDIKLYATMTSVDNIRDLSEHAYLRNHVRRIDFVSDLRYSVRTNRDLPWLEGIKDQKRREEELIKRSKYPWSSKQIYEGLAAFRRAYGEQKFVVEDLFEHMVAKRYLPQFPKFKLVRFSYINDLHPVVFGRDPTWLTENHPDILLRTMHINEEDHDATNHFVTIVLNALAKADTKPSELTFKDGCGIGPNFRWTDLRDPTVIEELQTFDLYIHGMDTGFMRDDESTIEPHWGALIMPIQCLCKNMERFYIHVKWDLCPADADLDEILDIVRFPRLKDFHLDRCRNVSGTAFAEFLGAHPLLEEISHGSESPGLTDRNWSAYWKALGNHPNLSKFTLVHEPPWLGADNPLWIWTDFGRPDMDGDQESDEEDAHQALYDYVHKKGPWTEELAEMWR